MKIADAALMDSLLQQAAESPRRRAHHNFHPSLEDPIHRLLIAAMPDTDFPTHRHRDKWELFTLLRGEVEATLFTDDGQVIEQRLITPGGETAALEVPAGCFHRYIVRKPSVILEVKPGPYVPIGPEDTANF